MNRMAQHALVTQVEDLTPGLTRITFSTESHLAWRSGQHLKIEVAPYTFRDYTLASWDILSQSATLLVHTGHHGAGADWASQLLPGDAFRFAGPAGGQHQPSPAPHLVCLGDTATLGHFHSLFLHCDLEQYFTAAINVSRQEARALTDTLEMPVLPAPSADNLRSWLNENKLSIMNTTFYLAGETATVLDYRNKLRSMGVQGANVKAVGFWD